MLDIDQLIVLLLGLCAFLLFLVSGALIAELLVSWKERRASLKITTAEDLRFLKRCVDRKHQK